MLLNEVTQFTSHDIMSSKITKDTLLHNCPWNSIKP